jgi:hypothetical protein
MLTEDYLMRIISQALAALMTALGLRKAGKYSEAWQALQQAIEHLTMLPANLVDQMDDAAVLTMLTTEGQLDVGRLAVLADLYREQGEILLGQERKPESTTAFARALRFDLEVALAELPTPSAENIAKVETLRPRLAASGLPVDTQLALADYYRRLLDMNEADLTAAGCSRAAIDQAFTRLQSQIDSNPNSINE